MTVGCRVENGCTLLFGTSQSACVLAEHITTNTSLCAGHYLVCRRMFVSIDILLPAYVAVLDHGGMSYATL